MKKYDKYKFSDIEWIGDIPEHWKVIRMLYILRSPIVDGPHETPEYVNDGIPFISVDSLNNDEFVNLEVVKRYITQEQYNEYNKKTNLEKNDILFSKSATIGKVAIVDDRKFMTWSPLAIIKCNQNEFHYKYMYYILKMERFIEYIKSNSTFNTQFNIGMKVLEKSAIPFPLKYEEQQQIANFLDKETTKINEIIKDKEELIKFFEEEKEIIISDAVTKGLNPDVEMQDSGIEWIGDIPKHWEVRKLKYLGKFINGYSFNSNDFITTGIKVLKITNIQHMNIDWSDSSFVENKFYDFLKNYRVFKNDLVFALTRPIISTGIKVALINSNEKILINQRNSIFRTNNIKINFIYYMLLNKYFIKEFDNIIDKTGQQPNISSYDIGEIYIPFTNDIEQVQIVNYLDKETSKIDETIQTIKEEISLLKEYKEILIYEVVTGKIDVRKERVL